MISAPPEGTPNNFVAPAAGGGWSGASHELPRGLDTYNSSPTARPASAARAHTTPGAPRDMPGLEPVRAPTRCHGLPGVLPTASALELILGGDLPACLSDADIDESLSKRLGAHRYKPARFLYDVRTGTIDHAAAHKTVRDWIAASADSDDDRWFLAPMHVRYHWAACLFYLLDGDLRALVIDSAPSAPTQRDMRAVADALAVPVDFACIAKQAYNSFECGLFVVLIGLLVAASFRALRDYALATAAAPVASLAAWRAMLPHAPAAALLRAADLPPAVRALGPTHAEPAAPPCVCRECGAFP